MFLFSGLLARLVPIMLWASAVLVLARLVHDRLAPRRREAAAAAFGALLLGGALAAVPYARRSAALLLAERSFLRRDWKGANAGFARAFRPGARIGAKLRVHWGTSLMNEKRWSDAERVLVGVARRTKDGGVTCAIEVMQAVGICRYYAGRLPLARRTLEAAYGPSTAYLSDYFLGRIAEISGDAGRARESYDRSWRAAPGFLPALYQLVRIDLLAGRPEEARRLLSGPAAAAVPGTAALREAVDRPGGLPPKEFFIVQGY